MDYKGLLKRKIYTRRELTELYERSTLDTHYKTMLQDALRSNAIHMLHTACVEQHLRLEDVIPYMPQDSLEKYIHSYTTYNNFINLSRKWVSLTMTRYHRHKSENFC